MLSLFWLCIWRVAEFFFVLQDPDAEPTPSESDLLSVSSDDTPPPAPTPAELEEKVAYQALLEKREAEWPVKKAADASEWSFKMVFEYGTKIELDHHLVYHARECNFIIISFRFIPSRWTVSYARTSISLLI